MSSNKRPAKGGLDKRPAKRVVPAEPDEPVAGPSHILDRHDYMPAPLPSPPRIVTEDRLEQLMAGISARFDQMAAQIAACVAQTAVAAEAGDGAGGGGDSEDYYGVDDGVFVPCDGDDGDGSDGDAVRDAAVHAALDAALAPEPSAAGVSCPVGDDQDEQDPLMKVLDAFKSDVKGYESEGMVLPEKVRASLEANLRSQPHDATIASLASQYPLPSNLPSLKVPAMNPEILTALSKSAKLMDSKLSKSTTLMARALVPSLRYIVDFMQKGDKRDNEHCINLLAACRLQCANINYMYQTRKDLVKIFITDPALMRKCTWDCKIGEDTLFPSDISKVLAEDRKAFFLTRSRGRGGQPFRGGRPRGRGNYYNSGFNRGFSSRGRFGQFNQSRGGSRGSHANQQSKK